MPEKLESAQPEPPLEIGEVDSGSQEAVTEPAVNQGASDDLVEE